MDAVEPAKESIPFNFESLAETAKDNLYFSYIDFSELNAAKVNDYASYEQKETLGEIPQRGISAVPALLTELVLIIYHAVKLILWDAAYSLFNWNSDYLCARTFQLLRDGEAFAGTCLLVADVIEGHLLIEHANLHRDAYETFLQHQFFKNPLIIQEPDQNLEAEEPIDEGTELSSISDHASYQKVRGLCYQASNYELLFKAAETYASLLSDTNQKDDIYVEIVMYFSHENTGFIYASRALEKLSPDRKITTLNIFIKIQVMRESFLGALQVLDSVTLLNNVKNLFLIELGEAAENKGKLEIALTVLERITVITPRVSKLTRVVASDCFNRMFDNKLISRALDAMRRLDMAQDEKVDEWYLMMIKDHLYSFSFFIEAGMSGDERDHRLHLLIKYYFEGRVVNNYKQLSLYDRRILALEIVGKNLNDYKSQILNTLEQDFENQIEKMKSDLLTVCQSKIEERTIQPD